MANSFINSSGIHGHIDFSKSGSGFVATLADAHSPARARLELAMPIDIDFGDEKDVV